MSFGSFSLRELTCMHCVYLALWTRKVLCGSFLCAIYKFSFIHSFISSSPALYSFTTRNKLPITLSVKNFYENYWSSNDNNYQQYYRKHSTFQSRDPSNTLARSTMLILFTDTYTHMLAYRVQPLTHGQHPPSCLIPLHNKSRTQKKSELRYQPARCSPQNTPSPKFA